jgi:hypothetical protein
MKPYEERWKEAASTLIGAYSHLELYFNELGGIGFNLGTRLYDQGNGSLKMSFDENAFSELEKSVTRIANEHSLDGKVSKPELERQVGVYVSWIYLDDNVS